VSRTRVALIVGTRPDAIKMAPVILACRERADRLDPVVIATAQHREMLGQVLDAFGIAPDVDLDVMRPDQRLGDLTARLLVALDGAFVSLRPDVVVVQGDTTSTFASALAAYYERIPVAHVEAGLRSGDPQAPFPEEQNRRLADALADLWFAPTEGARAHLVREGVDPARVLVTGNTGIDALLRMLERNRRERFVPRQIDPAIVERSPLLVVTAHRRESFGRGIAAICRAVRRIAQARGDLKVVFPVHPNPRVSGEVHAQLAALPNVHLTAPLEYREFVHVMAHADLILTDSGGIQEEVASLGARVLVMRERTERPEAIDAGVAELVGTDPDTIVTRALDALDHPRRQGPIANPFGDGRASERIVRALIERYAAPTR
jgi:UDP-N-acetylglucosamine 2-epimerase (non-hydrolysing)